MIDRGIPFNPLEKEDPDISGPIDERRIGGLGIFILKQTNKRHYSFSDQRRLDRIKQKMTKKEGES